MRPIDQLADISISELTVGTAAFRRKLTRAGYASLAQAFDASDDEIDERFISDFDTIGTLEKLKHSYEKDPDSFVAEALRKDSGQRSS